VDVQKVTWDKGGSEPADDYTFYEPDLETPDIPNSEYHDHFPMLVVAKNPSKTLCDIS
jgi:hypothetical protein